MKNRIYRSLKLFLLCFTICTTLFAGPLAHNEVSKILKCMDERNAVIREMNEVENEENEGDMLKRKNLK